MATTRTPGITVLSDGRRFIDKRYLGVRIGRRVGAVTQEQGEERLDIEIARVQCDLARKARARPTFTDCAARYVAQSRGERSIAAKVSDFGLCDLRAKGATDEYRAGRPIRELQNLLGHKSVRTTEIYLKELIPETVRPNERPMIAGSK